MNSSCRIIADCDECRLRSTNPYVKSSSDLEAVFTIGIEGLGSLCRRERQGDYFHFEELRYISCDKCQTKYHMPRTVYDETVDLDHHSMKKRSGIKAHQIQILMEGPDNPCHQHHINSMTILSDELDKFTSIINRVPIGHDQFNQTKHWCLYQSLELYLYWRLPHGKFICGREQHKLIILAHDYDANCLFRLLPRDVLNLLLTK